METEKQVGFSLEEKEPRFGEKLPLLLRSILSCLAPGGFWLERAFLPF